MKKSSMQVHNDKEEGILEFSFKDGPNVEVGGSAPNIIVELDENKQLMGLEI